MKKVMSALLSAAVTLGVISGMCVTGHAVHHESGFYVARTIMNEGIVLLKNENNALPLQKGEKTALFGEAQKLRLYSSSEFDSTESMSINTLSRQHGYIAYGAGSSQALGDGGVKAAIDPLAALESAEKEGKISLYHAISDAYIAPLLKSRCDEEYTEYKPTDADVAAAAAEADTAIVFLRRWDGECVDMTLEDWELTNTEATLLKQVSAAFRKVVVVLNTPAPITTEWAKDRVDGIHVDAVLFAGYGGMQGGQGIADVLLGDVTPSGKLVDTYASAIGDYPTSSYYTAQNQLYSEDIFLGYRWFETFDPEYKKVNYEFGFGLSYTTFAITTTEFTSNGDDIEIKVNVKNTGEKSGKEVVQVYVKAPQGALGKAAKSLCAFQKTALLAPGEEQTLSISIDLSDIASFDDTGKTGCASAWVLEEGEYVFFVGNSVRNVTEAGKVEVEELIVTEQLSQKCATNLDKRLLADGTYEKLEKKTASEPAKAETPEEQEEKPAKTGFVTLYDVVKGDASLRDLTAQMTTDELATFFVSYPGNKAGASESVCTKYGLTQFRMADGPHGFNGNGTSFPCETILACTWNPDLAEAMGLIVGSEGYQIGIGMWLAPAVNLHRNPAAGRNSEYYSEDPLVSGTFAARVIAAAQSMGLPACVKHFVCNEKEKNKLASDSRVSERALRELYLKPFEMAVKQGGVIGVMSSYNKVNGVAASENRDLLTGILREEWGFEGFVTGDWNNNKDAVKEVNAGNNVREPASYCDITVLLKAIAEGKITRETLETGAAQVLYVIMRTKPYYSTHLCGDHTFENGVCTRCHTPSAKALADVSATVTALIEKPAEKPDASPTPAAPGDDAGKGGKAWLLIPAAAVVCAGAAVAVILVKKKKKDKKTGLTRER